MSRSEVGPTHGLLSSKGMKMCFYAFIDSYTVDESGSIVARAFSSSKYTRVPLAHARHVNNTVLCILLSRSNDEWTCIYVRSIGTISDVHE